MCDPAELDRIQDMRREHGAPGLRACMLRAMAEEVAWELYGFKQNRIEVVPRCTAGRLRHEADQFRHEVRHRRGVPRVR